MLNMSLFALLRLGHYRFLGPALLLHCACRYDVKICVDTSVDTSVDMLQCAASIMSLKDEVWSMKMARLPGPTSYIWDTTS